MELRGFVCDSCRRYIPTAESATHHHKYDAPKRSKIGFPSVYGADHAVPSVTTFGKAYKGFEDASEAAGYPIKSTKEVDNLEKSGIMRCVGNAHPRKRGLK